MFISLYNQQTIFIYFFNIQIFYFIYKNGLNTYILFEKLLEMTNFCLNIIY